MTMTTTPDKYEVATPEYFVLRHRPTREHFAGFSATRRGFRVDIANLYHPAVHKYDTPEAASKFARENGLDGRIWSVVRVRAELRCTEAGRADVLARRAARNAERKF